MLQIIAVYIFSEYHGKISLNRKKSYVEIISYQNKIINII